MCITYECCILSATFGPTRSLLWHLPGALHHHLYNSKLSLFSPQFEPILLGDSSKEKVWCANLPNIRCSWDWCKDDGRYLPWGHLLHPGPWIAPLLSWKTYTSAVLNTKIMIACMSLAACSNCFLACLVMFLHITCQSLFGFLVLLFAHGLPFFEWFFSP